MTIHMRSYAGANDIPPIILLKRLCTTEENRYDFPTVSDLQALLTPIPMAPTAERPAWEDAQGAVIPHLHRRAMTQRATILWEEEDGTLVAYALLIPPSLALTFQVLPHAHGLDIATQILTWAVKELQIQVNWSGRSFFLWCRYHDTEPERRALLEEAGFHPLWAHDLRLVCSLDSPLEASPLPPGFTLRRGVHGKEIDQYQELHRAVFDGTSMGLEYHESPDYQPDLDLIAVDAQGTFAAFCLCQRKEVSDGSGVYPVGEIGVIGTHPAYRKQGLGRALLRTSLRLLHERGARAAFLETEQTNLVAQQLFASVGFRTVSTWQWLIKEISPSA